MTHFAYRDNILCADHVPLTDIARQYGTPLYVYSKTALTENYLAYADALKKYQHPETPGLVCFSVKSNSNLAVLKILGDLGSGFDIVSGGELSRVIAAGCDPRKAIFSGVGKTKEEIRFALENDILCFNIESPAELNRINEIAGEMGTTAPISFRVNPDVDAKTHPYISTGLKENKFGVAFDEAFDCYKTAAAMPNIRITGIDCHIGSQLLDDGPLLEAFDRLVILVDRLSEAGIELHHIDIGGGIGIAYHEEKPVAVPDYLARLYTRINAWRNKQYGGKPIQLMLEPGRSISGNAGVLLTEVQYLKTNTDKNYAIVDAAMNDLMRPALYDAWHTVLPVHKREMAAATYDIVGPICESGDWLAKQRDLAVTSGDLLAIMSAGAYGMVMASNYNTRGKAAEVIVDHEQVHLVRRRESAEDLFAFEKVLP
ncbi:diaminopimelate decarboxylase [Oxalobacter vibrioformis]|uniref:Diaminopimelate decarboxylase n=1 Tax=Oxalobacter vibrioformis TaxID=933080 RepID=A0A9E9P5R8_9BURK|nr:diaminopimelate decarboxylase [Oxalobacter vibrioformis]WAW11326.1 diaminopimelate decarboxylase [Oxalobacter vibrioformis]